MTKLRNEDSVAIQRGLLEVFGLWPVESPTFIGKLRTALSYFMAYLNVLAMFYALCTTKDYLKFMRNCNFFLGFLTDALKITVFYFNWPKFLKLLGFLKSPIFYSYHENLEKHLIKAIKTSTAVVKTFQVIFFFTIITISSIPLLNKSIGKELPFDYGVMEIVEKSRFLYLIFYVFQIFALILAAFCCIGVDGIATGLMGLAAAYFRVLQGTIRQVTKSYTLNKNEELTIDDYGKFDERVNKKLKDCVDLHLGIIKFAETIEEMFTYSFFLQFLISGVYVCVASFMFITTTPESFEFLMTLAVLGTVLFQISIYCVFGDEVIRESLKVEDACYTMDWTYCGPKVRKTLLIVTERSKRPLVLTAGKFFNLSLSSLLAILKSGFSYGTVLKQFYNKQL